MWRASHAGKGRQTCECDLPLVFSQLSKPASLPMDIQCSFTCLQRSCTWLAGSLKFDYLVPTKQEIMDRKFTLRVFERGTRKQLKSAKFDPEHFRDDSETLFTSYTLKATPDPHENVHSQQDERHERPERKSIIAFV